MLGSIRERVKLGAQVNKSTQAVAKVLADRVHLYTEQLGAVQGMGQVDPDMIARVLGLAIYLEDEALSDMFRVIGFVRAARVQSERSDRATARVEFRKQIAEDAMLHGSFVNNIVSGKGLEVDAPHAAGVLREVGGFLWEMGWDMGRPCPGSRAHLGYPA